MGSSIQPHGVAHVQEDIEATTIDIDVLPTTETICDICKEPLSLVDTFNNDDNNNNLCSHPFCKDCIAKYIKFKIQENNRGNIPCPALNCEQMLDPMSCRTIISKQLLDKWCDALCLSALPEVRHRCYCPLGNCSTLIINECGDKSVTRVRCLKCKGYFCFKCQVAWHEGKRCGRGRNDRGDPMFEALVQKKRWRRCYNCGHWVERLSGCRIIHCRCGVSFCYSCGGQHLSNTCPTWNEPPGNGIHLCVRLFMTFLMVAMMALVFFVYRNFAH